MKQLITIKKNQKRLVYKKGTEKNRIFFSKKNNFILQSLGYSLLTDKQLKAIYNFIRRRLKKVGLIIQHVFTNIGLTKKPVEIRMGKGKGNKMYIYVYTIRPGKVLFELQGVNAQFAYNLFYSILNKLSLKGKIFQI